MRKRCQGWVSIAVLALAGLSLAYHPWLEKEVERGEWNPHAGLRPSYTDGIVPRVSSNARDAARITDGDPGTFWQSGAHLPEGFVARKDLNLFLRSPRCWSAPKGDDTAFADGNFHSFVTVPADSIAQLSIRFQKPQFFSLLGLKAHCSVPLLVEGEFENGDRQLLLTFTPSDNFQLKKTEVKAVFQALHLRSAQPFDLYEVAALDEEPTEWAVFDFGGAKKLGWVRARVWAGEETAYRTEVYASADSLRWDFLGELNPESTETQDLRMSPPIEARYLKIVHYLLQKDWNKVFLWEVDAYDEHGPYGPRPAPRPSSTTLAEFLGVNGYWGWGYKRYSDELPAGHGPALFARLFRHARNYHDLSWDLRRPEDSISFEAMAQGKGTPAMDWLDWDREYRSWNQAGLNVQASIQFFRFAPESWTEPYRQAYRYGYAFARHFGPTHGNGLVCTMEVGNEPWKYDADTYRQILLGMASGAKAADPRMEVLPCALQAADPSLEALDGFRNYMGARIPPEAAPLLDGLNLHVYSYRRRKFLGRMATYPEDPESSFWEILPALRWRDQNLPDKKIYLTEFGWDSDGAGEPCLNWACVSEEAAAAYAVRAALIASRLGIDKAYWYFFANVDGPPSLYNRSGLTGSLKTGFAKKRPYLALESLLDRVGDHYFLDVVQENEEAWAYLLGTADGTPTHLVAWLPMEGDSRLEKSLVLKLKGNPEARAAWYLDGAGAEGRPAPLPLNTRHGLRLLLTPKPLLVELQGK